MNLAVWYPASYKSMEIRHMKRKVNQGIGRGRVRICFRVELLQRLRGALRLSVRAMAAVTWAVLGFVWRVPSKRKGLVPARTIPSFEDFVRAKRRCEQTTRFCRPKKDGHESAGRGASAAQS